ncbi:MAG: hypothetical protein GWN58_23965, partial [Anaerolineae bacterium]|nr:hypothetical protein [Anaerolineae bacterium]
MSAMSPERHAFPVSVRWSLLALFILVLLLAGCGERGEDSVETPAAQADAESGGPIPTFIPQLEVPLVDLVLSQENVLVEPAPLRAGFPFTVTALIHNNLTVPAEDIPVMVLITAQQEQIGYTSYAELITITVPASQSLQLDLPVDWNFAGGEHRLWLQVNRLPDAWQDRART